MLSDYESLFSQYVKKFKKISEDQAIGCCVYHDDRHPSLSMQISTGLFNCKSAGCGEQGNAYQFAEHVGHPNPRNFINGASPSLIIPVNTVKKADSDDLLNKALEYQQNLNQEWLEKHAIIKSMLWGQDNTGRLVFPYFNANKQIDALKYHKQTSGGSPFWKGNGKCRIYGEHLLDEFDTARVLIICEGEKDTVKLLELGYQAVSFSAGAASIPKDISHLFQFKIILILYDNDLAGTQGAGNLAECIKMAEPEIEVYIGKWSEGLPDKYDVCDDEDNSEVEKALENAVAYELPLQGYKLVNMGEFQNMGLEKPQMVIDEISTIGGLTLLSGTDNSGKSMLSNQLALCTATGTNFLDYRVKRPFKTVVLSLENDDGEQQDRFEKQIKYFSKFYPSKAQYISHNLFHRIDVDEGKKFIKAWEKIFVTLKRNPDLEVLIVDNLTSTTDVKLSDNDALVVLLREIEWTARKNKVAVICLCHHRKIDINEKYLNKEMIRGGKSLTDFAWNVVQIHPSSIRADWVLFKITKIRHIYSEDGISTKAVPQLIVFDNESLFYHHRRAIPNEIIHFQAPNFNRPLEFIISLQGKNDNEQKWTTAEFINQGNTAIEPIPESTMKKWLVSMVKWGWLDRVSQGLYRIKWDIILEMKT